MCARCHTEERPTYANGAHTWHSAEFTDAVNGACYLSPTGSQKTLTCTHCHDPHGPSVKLTAADLKTANQLCISCHEEYREASALAAHTHHEPTSTGSNCLDCHMPRITEGLRNVVRSHRITSPTERSMIEKNQPNACNLCHLDKPIDWTINRLREWYGDGHEYADFELNSNYPNRAGAVGAGWLQGRHQPTRLVGADALARNELASNLPALLAVLANDDNAEVRRFTQRRIEERLQLRLRDEGYAFYQHQDQRRAVIARIRGKIETMAKALE